VARRGWLAVSDQLEWLILRSLRLGVRVESLARKPNTKIEMKKKTTE